MGVLEPQPENTPPQINIFPETNIAPKNWPSQKESNLPTIIFQGYVGFVIIGRHSSRFGPANGGA